MTRPRVGKRTFDLVVGIPLCVGALPVVASLSIALLVLSRVSPWFVHERIGRHATTIKMPKLRTLPLSTPAYADKTTYDLLPATGFSSWLRRTHLDELPQLFLVPIGSLSLVGPRPLMAAEAEEHGDEHYARVRTSLRQGCTGLWQISVDGTGRVCDSPAYDLFYAAQQTLRMDAWILWHTARQFFGGRRIALDDVPRWTLRSPSDAVARREAYPVSAPQPLQEHAGI
jgi:lipopolysaccharide/colanic/teichoic acid biosynthesis glycosyltransferase